MKLTRPNPAFPGEQSRGSRRRPILNRWAVLLACAFALLFPASEAMAQVRQCLVTASSAPVVVNYDPFNPTALSLANVAVTFTRGNGPGGAKPSLIDMYVQASSSAANGTLLIPTSVVGSGSASGLNQNIFYNTPGAVPNITSPLSASPPPGVLRWAYSGNNPASDVFVVNFSVTLPAHLNLEASTAISFNIQYGCDGTGGGQPFSEIGTAPNAFTLNINVRSGLQASWAGPDLDFGEVGDKTDADIATTPIIRTGYVRVASSGPYSISMDSPADYRMTYSGGSAANETQNLRYSATFFGQTRNPTNTTPVTRTCVRAGIGSPPLTGGQLLPVQVQILEGGSDEAAASYSDTLTFTITPLAGTTVGSSCP